MAKFDEKGHEILDSTPVAIPLHARRSDSLVEQVRRLVSQELARGVRQMGKETFEEADDFDVGDDPELKTPYELDDEVQGRGQFVEDVEVKKAPKPEPEKAKEKEKKGKKEPVKPSPEDPDPDGEQDA